MRFKRHPKRPKRTERRLRLELLEDRRVLAAPAAANDAYVLAQDQPLVTSVAGPLSVYEDFSDGALSSVLEGDGFTIEGGAIHRTSAANHDDRHYIRTRRADHAGRDFRFEVSLTLNAVGQVSIAFVGIGRGRAELGRNNQEPQDSLFFRIHAPDTADGFVSLSNNHASLGTLGHLREPGTHRVRIEKMGKRVEFSIDAHYNGTFTADLSHTIDDLGLTAPYLNNVNTHLFFGTALPEVVFDDVLIEYSSQAGVLANDFDPENEPFSAELLEPPTHGEIQLAADGTFTYTPAPGFHGLDQFRYVARAADGDSEPATVLLEVIGPPVRSVATADNYETQEDQPLEVDSAIQDFRRISLPRDSREMVFSAARNTFYLAVPDPDAPGAGIVLPIDAATGEYLEPIPVGGGPNQLAVSPDGHWLYVGLDQARALRRVDLETGVMSDPVSLGQLVAEDIEVIPGRPESIAVTLADRRFSPRVADTVIYDDMVRRNVANLPRLSNSFAFNDDGSFAVGFLAELSSRAVNIVETTENGWKHVLLREHFIPGNPEGEIKWIGNRIFFDSGQVFDPDGLEFVGLLPYGSTTADAERERFYSVTRNEIVVSDTQTTAPLLRFPVPGLPDEHGPRNLMRVGDDGLAFQMPQDELIMFRSDLVTRSLRPRGVLANDVLATDELPALLRVVEPPSHGTVTLNRDGSFRYEPDTDFSGEDHFTYAIVDSSVESDPATVTIQVLPGNDAPAAAADQYELGQSRMLSTVAAGGVLANDVDPDGDPITAVLDEAPQHGQLTLHPDGSFVYTPDADFVGQDAFTYHASDGQQVSSPVTVSLDVVPRSILVSLRAVAQPSATDRADALPPSLEQVDVGSDYFVELWVQNIGAPAAGISGGQVDVLFDPLLVDATQLSHGQLFNQVPTGELIEDAGLVDDFGGGTVSPDAGTAPQWARLGYVRVTATADGTAVYEAQHGRLRFSLLGQGNVSPQLVDFTESLVVRHYAGAELAAVVVRQPTPTGQSGEVAELPENEPWIDEWSSYWLEIWTRSTDSEASVRDVSVDVFYDSTVTSAIEIQPGPALEAVRGAIDDPAGRIEGLGGTIAPSGLVGADYLLVARVRFAAQGDDQVPVDPQTGPGASVSGGWSLAGPSIVRSGDTEPVPVELGSSPTTPIWSVLFDVDDNNLIDYGDLSIFAPAFGLAVGTDEPPYAGWADFDGSGEVDFGDFSYLAANFGLERGAGDVNYPPGYPPSLASPSSDLPDANSPPLETSSSTLQVANNDVRPLHVALVVRDVPSNGASTAKLPTSLTDVEVGQSYVLEIWLQDQAEQSTGITGGQIDLRYPSDRVTVSSMEHGDVFTTLATGAINAPAGLVDDFGGATLLGARAVAPQWERFGMIPFSVNGPGRVIFEVKAGRLQFSRFGQGNLAWSVVELPRLVLNHRPGDVDGDLDVDSSDLNTLITHWTGAAGGESNRQLEQGDLDGDGDIDTADLNLLISQWTGAQARRRPL